ncbi:hypothetical protein ILYODFUR_032131 [Ilyodon furcidens]|uniref:Uncharacterized protein n=1 Tax=Ilyodon furcidens TaxID=33524 RepID=A0ABV0UCV5_9TELE
MKCVIHPPIYSDQFPCLCCREARTRRLPLIRDRVAGAAGSAETPRRPSPQTPPPAPPRGAQGVPRPIERHSPSSVSWAVPRASSRWDVPGRREVEDCRVFIITYSILMLLQKQWLPSYHFSIKIRLVEQTNQRLFCQPILRSEL